MSNSDWELPSLENRRREILHPNVTQQLLRLWPPADFISVDPGSNVDTAVAFVSDAIPDPGHYDPVARHAAELLIALSQNGSKPTFLYLGPAKESSEASAAIRSLGPAGLFSYQYVDSPEIQGVSTLLGPAVDAAYRLYEWLKRRDFDVVHGTDWGGALYYCLRAKEQGIAFAKTRFVVHPLGGILERSFRDYESFNGVEELVQVHLERSCLGLADVVPISCRKTLRRLLDCGVSLSPERIQQGPQPFDGSAASTVFGQGSVPAKPHTDKGCILCLPGLSRRGISLFCTALARGFQSGNLPFRIEFVVPPEELKTVRFYLKRFKNAFGSTPRVHDVGDRSALAELLHREPDTLCVLPVLDDWNRYQLLDLAAGGKNLLVCDPEGAAETLGDKDVEKYTCLPLPDAIMEHLHVWLRGKNVAPGFVSENSVPLSWVTPPEPQPEPSKADEVPRVTVCLMHFERPRLLEQALASLEGQTYSNFEVVLVDDGSLKAETLEKLDGLEAPFKDKGWRIIRQQNRYLGAARNTAAMAAEGDYLYFLDDDNVLKPNGLETFVHAALHTGADVVTSFADVFSGTRPPESLNSASRRIVPIGDDLAFGLFYNGFGDSNALIRKSTFLALGGNTEDYGVGLDDQEFFARAVLNGHKLRVVPEALYWARQMPNRLRNRHFNPKAGNVRVCRTYMPHIHPKLQPLLLLAVGLMEASFEGKDISLRGYVQSKLRKAANSPSGLRLRFGLIDPVIRRLREWFRRGG